MLRFFTLLLLCPTTLLAQFNESFTDGEILNNPRWFGEIDSFSVSNDFRLQLNGQGAGSAFLYVPCEVVEEASWSFSFLMEFNPSSSNYARVYLAMDNENLDLLENAIYLDLGSSGDRIDLMAVENGETFELARSSEDLLDVSSNEVQMEVRRNADNWTLRYNKGSTWQEIKGQEYKTSFASIAFGIYCQYTKTRKDKFFFDDIVVIGEPFVDDVAPELTHFDLLNGETILLKFNETLDVNSIQNEDFYLKQLKRSPASYEYDSDNHSLLLHYNPGLNDIKLDTLTISGFGDLAGNNISPSERYFEYKRVSIESAKLIDLQHLVFNFTRPIPLLNWEAASILLNDDALIYAEIAISEDEQNHVLELKNTLADGQSYQLHLSNLKDDRGDTIHAFEHEIFFYQTKRYDLVFNELMVDPSPALDLPEHEYIELYNRSDFDIDLKHCILEVNQKSTVLPQTILKARDYCVLVPENAEALWPTETVSVAKWPTLGNDGFKLVLRDSDRMVIDAYLCDPDKVNGETFKQDGGWSIERVDINNLSGHFENYMYSLDLAGGTPGKENSVKAKNIDEDRPIVQYLELLSDTAFCVVFNETMHLNSETWSYEIIPDLDGAKVELIDSVFYSSITFDLGQTLNDGTLYELHLNSLSDWADNDLIIEYPLKFRTTDSLELGDVLINEVLFNPHPDGVDFIELVNVSSKTINISDLYLAQLSDEGTIKQLFEVCDKNRLLFPHDYLVLSEDSLLIQAQYQCENPNFFLNVKKMPSMPDDEGSVVLCDKYGIIIDQMAYEDKMHFDLIKDSEGVSLERLSLSQSSMDMQNWHSAASDIGYATPSYNNSQAIEDKTPTSIFEFDSDVFSPNGDGIDDQLVLRYKSQETGGSVTIRIYDASGNEIRYLINNQLMASEGFYVWDGLGENGQQLMPGIYVIWIQCHYPSGNTTKEKMVCVIAQGTP
ncbi:lamin tail domain-containing protein [Carboxylicivirga sp. N1Y90]|uniref:lamin tail domain-containing protein n=1 Tax=Carboxylicivirga fragile TaxID=3417571 RepID=UPI003D335D7F|nr:lamin tail domain-containing protein [Marinilabiliaceae bacterium N1Y90]